MSKNSTATSPAALLCAALVLLALTGCVTAGSGSRSHPPARPAGPATVMIEDDYEYYPRHEIYYSRRQNEYVYRDNNAWVRRSELRGITLSMLTAGPMVRMDFRDSPEFHHHRIVQRYPRNWEQSGPDQAGRKNRQADSKSDEPKE